MHYAGHTKKGKRNGYADDDFSCWPIQSCMKLQATWRWSRRTPPPRLHLRRGSFVSKWNWKAACLVCIQLMPLAFLANNSIARVCVWFLLIGRRKSRSMVSPCQNSPLKLHYSFSFHFYAHRLWPAFSGHISGAFGGHLPLWPDMMWPKFRSHSYRLACC